MRKSKTISPTKSKDVIENEKIFESYKQSERGNWAKVAVEDRGMLFNQMWEQADATQLKADDQIITITNELVPTINLVVAQLTSNTPRFKAIGREKSDNEVASNVSDLYAWIWYISNGDMRLRTSVKDLESIGMMSLSCYIDPSADNNKGEIFICDIDPLELYIDPDSKDNDCQDAKHILIVKRLASETIELYYPDFDFKGAIPCYSDDYPESNKYAGDDQTLKVSDTLGVEKYEVIDRYSKVRVPRYHIFDPQTNFQMTFENDKDYQEWASQECVIITKLGRETYATDPKAVQELKEVAKEYGNIYHVVINPQTQEPEILSGVEDPRNPFTQRGSTTYLTFQINNHLLETGVIKYTTPRVPRIKRVLSIGGKQYYNDILPRLTRYPFGIGQLHHSRNPFPMGDIRLVKSLQQQLNKIDQLIITYHQNIASISFFVPKGSGTKDKMEKNAKKSGVKIFEYDPELGGIPILLQYQQMSNGFYNQRQNLINQIQRVIGAYSFQDGSMVQAPETKGGMQLLDEAMQRRTADKRKIVENALNNLGKAIAELIPVTYTERKAIRLIVPNHEPKSVVFNDPQERDGNIEIFNDLTSMEFDVQVVSGSSLPNNKMEQLNKMVELYQGGVIKNPKLIIENLDIPNVDEVLQSEDIINQAQGMIQNLEDQIKSQEGLIQTLKRQLIQAGIKVEEEKVKQKMITSVNKATNKIEATTVVVQKAMTDSIKKQKTAEKP